MNGSVILKFVVIRAVDDVSLIVAAAGERAADAYGRRGALRDLAAFVSKILKSRFIDDVCAECLGIAHLQSLLGRQGIVGLRRQRESCDSIVHLIVAKILVTHRQGVCFAQLIIHPW